MSLGDIVNRSERPATVDSLAGDLGRLGLRSGDTVLVHSSLSSLGWVNGGTAAVILALEQALGRRGTLVMPTQSGEWSNPAMWCNPPVPEDWWQTIATTMPAWQPDLGPTSGMGAIPDQFLGQRGTRRSHHPQHSFAARGRLARRLTARHPLEHSLGEDSPLASLYELGAAILLLGTDWDSCTALHLAEYRCDWPGKCEITEYAAIRRRAWQPPWRAANDLGGPGRISGLGPWRREWTGFRMLQFRTDDFCALGRDFEARCLAGGNSDLGGAPGAVGRPALRTGKVGMADCRLVDLRSLVDFAVEWLPRNR